MVFLSVIVHGQSPIQVAMTCHQPDQESNPQPSDCDRFSDVVRMLRCVAVLQYRVSDWREFLLRKLVGANTLQPSLHAKAKTNFHRCSLRPGMWLEVVDRTCLSMMTVATVDRVVGSRVRLRYLQSEVKRVDVVMNEDILLE